MFLSLSVTLLLKNKETLKTNMRKSELLVNKKPKWVFMMPHANVKRIDIQYPDQHFLTSFPSN